MIFIFFLFIEGRFSDFITQSQITRTQRDQSLWDTYNIYILTKKTHYFRITYVVLFSLFFYYKCSGIYFVLLIFSFGIYELFISKIDAACTPEDCNSILNISSLDQLKDKIAKVIIMVLVVNYFQRVLHTKYETPLELLYFALAIVALAVGLYFIAKVGKK